MDRLKTLMGEDPTSRFVNNHKGDCQIVYRNVWMKSKTAEDGKFHGCLTVNSSVYEFHADLDQLKSAVMETGSADDFDILFVAMRWKEICEIFKTMTRL